MQQCVDQNHRGSWKIQTTSKCVETLVAAHEERFRKNAIMQELICEAFPFSHSPYGTHSHTLFSFKKNLWK